MFNSNYPRGSIGHVLDALRQNERINEIIAGSVIFHGDGLIK